MALPRFWVDLALQAGERVELPAPVAHHAGRVLRLRAGDECILFNGRGGEFRARLAPGGLAADVLAFDPVEREARLRISLVQALTSADKTDWIVEKAVELGVARLIVVPSARSTVRLDGERGARRLAHWRDLVASSCGQCGRNRLMPVELADTPAQALALAGGEARFILDPAATPGAGVRAPGGSLALAVGPEGGFTGDELALAENAGYRRLRLGQRILRTETAGLAACAAFLAICDEYS